jgi:hypothetical protein
VCPADPPAGFPKGAYYRPFIDGPPECKAVKDLSVTDIPPPAAAPVTQTGNDVEGPGDCAAVLYGDTGRVSAYGYGAGWGAATVEDALKVAHAQMDKKGIVYGSPTAYTGSVFQGCQVPHGAVAGVRDTQKENDEDIVVVTLAFGKGPSTDSAEQNAVSSCERLPNSAGKTCEVLSSW